MEKGMVSGCLFLEVVSAGRTFFTRDRFYTAGQIGRKNNFKEF